LAIWQTHGTILVMSIIMLELSPKLDAALTEAMEYKGIFTKEEYVLRAIAEHCAPPATDGSGPDGTDGSVPGFSRDEAWIERMVEEGKKLRALCG
jgi:hypothetical protein